MSVLNELIGSVSIRCIHRLSRINLLRVFKQVKFIKFFAWEKKWIDKAMNARAVELGWIIKCNYLYLALFSGFEMNDVFRCTAARINSINFSGLWVTASILVSFISFSVYVLSGNELTVGVAFTVRQSNSFISIII